MVKLVVTLHNRVIEKYPRNQYAAERQARELLRTYRTDTRIQKQLHPGRIVLVHRGTGDRAEILLEEGTDHA